ncbi:MAG: hypothetical protein ACK4IU_06800 [Tabrizicola flagellatus]|uniref:hypothetical protein n=1 Tax=Tabrizicola flagellatus TaxID=2593021 RepID=UPI00391DD712
MKLRTTLSCYAAAVVLSAGAAFAAVDGNALADRLLAEGYDFVGVKVGPTQTKVEAIKGTEKVEIVYDNEALQEIKREVETADADEIGRTGREVRTVKRDFERFGDDDKNRRHGKGADDDDEDHDRKGRGSDDDHDDDHGRGGDDHGGGDNDGDRGGDDD